MMADYIILWQLCDFNSRADVDLTDYKKEFEEQRKQFNMDCKAGQIIKQEVKVNQLTSTYQCSKKLIKPGAALHAYSQGLIENYSEFEGMLRDSKPKRLFEYK